MDTNVKNYSTYNSRQQKLINLLIKKGELTYEFLAQELDVSVMTIRRDVDLLLENNIVKKTNPGSIELKISFEIDPGYEERHQANLNEKIAIAYEASKLITSGMVIGLDASSTTIELSKFLTKSKNLKVVTNSLLVPYSLAGTQGVEVILSGGIFRHEALSMVGQSACQQLNKYNYNIVFFSVNAIDVNRGLTDTSEQEVNTKVELLKNADKKVLLVDSSKFNRISFCFCCEISDIDILITDSNIKDKDLNYIKKEGIEVIIAEV